MTSTFEFLRIATKHYSFHIYCLIVFEFKPTLNSGYGATINFNEVAIKYGMQLNVTLSITEVEITPIRDMTYINESIAVTGLYSLVYPLSIKKLSGLSGHEIHNLIVSFFSC
jgi:hypothetical protein